MSAMVTRRSSGREGVEERARVDAEAELVLAQYLAGDATMQQLAERHGVSLWVIHRRIVRGRKLRRDRGVAHVRGEG